jgi:hypothetical protein
VVAAAALTAKPAPEEPGQPDEDAAEPVPPPAPTPPPVVAAASPAPKEAAPVEAKLPAAPVLDSSAAAWHPEIFKAVWPHHGAIQACVNKQHAAQPGQSGVLVMQWTVSASGVAAEIAAKRAELVDMPLATCLVDEIRTWSFKGAGATKPERVEFPFRY